jgi:hypothetical protein
VDTACGELDDPWFDISDDALARLDDGPEPAPRELGSRFVVALSLVAVLVASIASIGASAM